MKTALSIAGSDPSGGAGIQADIKTFDALGVHGMAVIASLTAQNSLGVQATFDLPADFVGSQIDSIARDMGFDAVKTGMLANREIVLIVASKMKRYRVKRLVVDPVTLAKGGAILLDADGVDAMIKSLLPLAYLTTPNIPEAEAIAGIKIRGIKDMERAAKKIKKETGAKNVLVKGGHLPGRAVDVLYDGRAVTRYDADRVETENSHGTGCALSAAIASELAKGSSLKKGVGRAKEFLCVALRYSFSIGGGAGPLGLFAAHIRREEEARLLGEMASALNILKKARVGNLLPEVQSNLACALTGAASRMDVAAFPGRIIRDGESIAVIHPPALGASVHIANVVLTNMRYDSDKRACMNIRYDKEIARAIKGMNLSVSSFDRAREPEVTRDREGATLEWGVKDVIERLGGRVPDVIFDKGGWGKEAMIRVIGAGPIEVARVVAKISRISR